MIVICPRSVCSVVWQVPLVMVDPDTLESALAQRYGDDENDDVDADDGEEEAPADVRVRCLCGVRLLSVCDWNCEQ